jgi:ornithine carbamoyltransferase
MSPAAVRPQPSVSFSARDLVFDHDLSAADVRTVLDTAAAIRKEPVLYRETLRGRMLALLFEKPSLRTRVTFEVAMKHLGGEAIFLDCRAEPIGQREPIPDVARNLERWVDAIVVRTFRQETVQELAEWSKVPVINALSDRVHPCQALADMLTLEDLFGSSGGLQGLKLAFLGDGNNVAHSLLLMGAKVGLHVAVATPAGDEPDAEITQLACAIAQQTGGSIQVGNDPWEAVAGASAVYTDVWTSMGAEQEANDRQPRFRPYQVTEKLLEHAGPKAVFLHCLPAHRGEEVEPAVMECSRSVVFHQAENRMHAQRALLWLLLAKSGAAA